ncbi:iron transporter [Campylobacter sp. MIT 97-5078]|uniref:iron transporter n=1 Tax=Campylobacter sp. MIT 97-5078 TaxID=1548153 RepID=UPI0005134FA1|nr:iron transporter [Campylobacter sp. MIT 97-5078]KGI56111.1 iron transporter [Campylobacter sp. MIT 97-5078]TQR25472.1 iron transporter [Campylobacter sp. MIT 97-5078]
MFKKTLLSIAAAAVFASSTFGAEVPIGDPHEINGMEIAAVYLQPIEMEPRGIDLAASLADIHLEADIHAIKGNKNGFPEGFWIPYLSIAYELKNLDTGGVKRGTFMPMVADDGPHYGANIAMEKDKSGKFGPGNYEVTYVITNPEKQGFGRHTDAETGVGKWFEPFKVSYKFKYTGTPK